MSDQQVVRHCESCGSDRTLKGEPLTGRYCSPSCLRIGNPDRFSANKHGRGYDTMTRGDRYEEDDARHAFNPFKDLFD